MGFYEDGAGNAQQMIEDQDEKLLKLLQIKRPSSEIGSKKFMSSFSQMTLIGILVLVGALLIAAIVAISSRSSRSTSQPLRAGIIGQSKKYAETLGTKPFETLNTAQKLLVLHAHYNLGKYHMVTQRAETMLDVFRQLSPERKQAFSEIVEDAYRQMGKDHQAVAFKYRIGP